MCTVAVLKRDSGGGAGHQTGADLRLIYCKIWLNGQVAAAGSEGRHNQTTFFAKGPPASAQKHNGSFAYTRNSDCIAHTHSGAG